MSEKVDLSKYGFRADYDENDRIVKQETITFDGKEYRVSTVDLGLDHSYGGEEPLYFETMIFPENEWRDMYCKRYNNREQAAKAHEKLVNEINDGKWKIDGHYFELKDSDSTEPLSEAEADANDTP